MSKLLVSGVLRGLIQLDVRKVPCLHEQAHVYREGQQVFASCLSAECRVDLYRRKSEPPCTQEQIFWHQAGERGGHEQKRRIQGICEIRIRCGDFNYRNRIVLAAVEPVFK